MAVSAYLTSTDVTGLIAKACIAIAGTVHLPEFSLANNHWCVNKAQVNTVLNVEACGSMILQLKLGRSQRSPLMNY